MHGSIVDQRTWRERVGRGRGPAVVHARKPGAAVHRGPVVRPHGGGWRSAMGAAQGSPACSWEGAPGLYSQRGGHRRGAERMANTGRGMAPMGRLTAMRAPAAGIFRRSSTQRRRRRTVRNDNRGGWRGVCGGGEKREREGGLGSRFIRRGRGDRGARVCHHGWRGGLMTIMATSTVVVSGEMKGAAAG